MTQYVDKLYNKRNIIIFTNHSCKSRLVCSLEASYNVVIGTPTSSVIILPSHVADRRTFSSFVYDAQRDESTAIVVRCITPYRGWPGGQETIGEDCFLHSIDRLHRHRGTRGNEKRRGTPLGEKDRSKMLVTRSASEILCDVTRLLQP